MQSIPHYLRSSKTSQKSKYVSQCVIQECGKQVRTTFGFSLYTILLLATLVIYFKSELGELGGLKPLESGKLCCHQHLKRVLYLISFHDNFILSRSLTVDFIFIFSFHFILFYLFIFFYFSIFRITRVRIYQSCCHISHKLMVQSQD